MGGFIAVIVAGLVFLAAAPAYAAPTTASRDVVPGAPGRIASAQAGCRGADVAPAGRTRRLVRLAVICLVNAERRRRGLSTLRSHARLQHAAFGHSVDMRIREYFSHVGSDGQRVSGRLKSAGYWPASAGENLGAGTGRLATARAIVEAWMESPRHRRNILDPRWMDIGVGVVTEYPAPPGPGATFTLVMGRRNDEPVRAHRPRRPAPDPPARPCEGDDLRPVGRTRRVVRLAIVCLVNAERRAHGLKPLTDTPRLQSAAFRQSVDMRVREYFSHVRPDGTTLAERLADTEYRLASAAELITQAVDGLATPRQVVAAWLRSPEHRASLLRREWREIGVGVVTEYSAPPQPGATYTLVVGRRDGAPGAVRLPEPTSLTR